MKRSRSRWMIAAGLLAGIAVAFMLLLSRANATAQAEFDARIAALEAAGEPVSIKDLARKPPLPQDNAATYLRRASDAIGSIDKEYSAAYDNLTPQQQVAADTGRPPAEYVAALRDALNAYPEALELVNQAAAAPAYDAQLDYSADPKAFWDELEKQTFQVTRRGMRLLSYQATLQLADGDAEGALKTSLKMLRLCRLLDSEPTLLGALVAFACRGIAVDQVDLALRAGPISEPLRRKLDEELAGSHIVEIYQRGLVGDRAFGLDTLRAIEAGKLDFKPDDKQWLMQLSAAFSNSQSKYLDFMAEAIALAGRPFADLQSDAKFNGLIADVDPSAKVVMPNIRAAQTSVYRCIVYLRGLQILNAIQRFERDHPGKEPTLADLGLPDEVITDPFNNQPLRLVKLPQGWSIYSVGMNLKDDGGRAFPEDVGLLVGRMTAEAEVGR